MFAISPVGRIVISPFSAILSVIYLFNNRARLLNESLLCNSFNIGLGRFVFQSTVQVSYIIISMKLEDIYETYAIMYGFFFVLAKVGDIVEKSDEE